MQKAITKKKSKAKGVSQRTRQHSLKGKPNRLQSSGHRKLFRGKNVATVKHLVPYSLKAPNKSISFMEVESQLGDDDLFGTEEKQLQVLKDIYPIVSSMKGFKPKPVNPEDSTAKVLTQMLESLDEAARVERYSIKKINGKYKLTALRMYGGERAIFIAVDFLAQINRSHTRLHDMIVWALRLVQQHNWIPVFHDWCKGEHTGEIYDWLKDRYEEMNLEEDEEYQLKYNNALQYYGPKGVPTAYSKILKGDGSLKIFKTELAKFNPSNPFEKAALPFLKAALELAETKKKMHDYCQNPGNNEDEYEGDEAKPNDYMQVIWSWDEDDLMFDMFNETIDSKANGYGVAGFCFEGVLNEGLGFKNSKNDPDIDFVDKCTKFFVAGNSMSHKIKDKLKGAPEQSPLPFNKKKI